MSMTKALIRYRATLLLAIALLLLGGVAAFGAVRLRQVISLQMRADTAAAICSTLQRQQYETLANMIDPAPVPPLATGAFNPHTFETQLHALDQHQGRGHELRRASVAARRRKRHLYLYPESPA